jgi:hypothetical protein
MSDSKRGILYLVWGNKGEELLQRSIQSVRKYYPDIPIHVERGDGQGGLMELTRGGQANKPGRG